MRLVAHCKDLPAPVHGRTVNLVNTQGRNVARIQTGVTTCCGMNGLHQFNLGILSSETAVKEFFDELARQPWKREDCQGQPPYYEMKHYIFTCGMGPYYENSSREDSYKYLIADPRVTLLKRAPSISEPGEGHDIGIFFVDLTK